MASDVSKQRGWLAQKVRDMAVATGLRPDSNSALAADLEAQGFSEEDMLDMNPARLEILKKTATRSVYNDARLGWIAFVKQEFEIEPSDDETRIFMDMASRRGGIVQRAKKIEKVSAGLQKGVADRQKQALAQVEEQVSGLAALLVASEKRGKLLEGALVRVLDQQEKQGDALGILLNRGIVSTPLPVPPASPPPSAPASPPAPFAGA